MEISAGMLGTPQDLLLLALQRSERALDEELDVTEQRNQRCSQLVRDGREELGLGAIRVLRLRVQDLQFGERARELCSTNTRYAVATINV